MFNNGSKVSATIICEKQLVNQHKLVWSWRLRLMLMTVVFVRLVSLHQCRPTLESASNYIIIIILDGFISDCMRIYSPRRTGSVNIIMTRAVYSHTTLNAIQYYMFKTQNPCNCNQISVQLTQQTPCDGTHILYMAQFHVNSENLAFLIQTELKSNMVSDNYLVTIVNFYY